ncbi:dynein axonemal assembly factor 8 [Anoplopoma fimbria]|uniref:dynein axonemal assembly factor 8 n=1 Tax=Anoplopoma fimbria TaxID=229290 RepID=UPI0023ECFA1A|nr:dynein axonemal assembly factor 8 [Anoplopoma fimbria]
MQTIVLLVLWVLGTSLVLPDPDTAGEKVAEEPIPCCSGCTCMHDDYSLEVNMYCSARNLTEVPSDMPLATHSLWLDGNLFTSLPAASFKDLSNLDFLNLQSGELVTLDPQAFKGLRSLAHIHLERNRIRQLPGTIFQNTPNLASISLHNNQLTRLEERLFAGLSNMWLLNLGWNSLAVLPETAFHDLQGLRELVLAGNRLAYLQPQLFQNLAELKELDLTGNLLKVIKANVFVKLTKLQKLYLAQNQIVTVAPRAFVGMKSLRWMDLTNNRLTSLHDDTFLGLHSLHVLRLSNNSITGIRPRTFRDLQYLEELRLSYNRIRALGERIFEGLGHLEVLELEHNQVQEAQVGSFTGLSHVAVINLSGSCFHSLPDQMFKGLSKLHSLHLDKGCLERVTTQAFTGLSGLRRLFLQHNNISVVERHSFGELVGLLGLDLSFNKMEVLTSHTFSGLRNLEYLLLSNNECRQFLQNGTKQLLPRLRYLDLRSNTLTSVVPDFPENMEKLLLSGNRWKCDCSSLPLRNYSLRNPSVIPRQVETHAEGEEPDTTITIFNNITCTSPTRLVGQDLRDIDQELFQSNIVDESENGDIATIYQRPAGLSLIVPEDFDLFSMEDGDLEDLLKPVPQTCWSEESVQLDDDENVEGTTVTRTQHSDADVEADACKRGIVELNRAKPDDSVKPNVDNKTDDGGFPVLSFARLDQWDLDDVLKNLDGLPLQQCVSVEPLKTHADDDKDRSQGNVMERLVAFCNSQSSQSVSEPVKSPNHIRHNNVWNKSSVRTEAELQLSQQECPRVYMDLRCPEPSIKPPRTSTNLSSESRSPAKLNNHEETPPAKKRNLKMHAGLQNGDREVTGKSMLLQKIREMNRNGKRHPNVYADPPNSVPENVPEKLPKSVESTLRHESHNLWGEKQSSHVQFEYRNPKMESQPTTQKITIKEPKQQSDQQRPRAKQTYPREQHQQILKQLEKHRPPKSVNQTQPSAENTDVLYDFEASHLQSISTLPADIESKGRMLLIVDLSSPGAVGSRAHRKPKHLNSAETKSDIYNTLVAWFLSLVGPEPRHDEDEVGAKVPFWVAGLQQLWSEDGLGLHVLAVARHSYPPRKRDKDLHTPFYNHVCRFLTETSLSLIATWLPQLRNLLDQRAYASPIHLPSSSLNCFISTTPNIKVIDRTFGLSPGFYWQTVETQEHVCKGRETTQELQTEVSVALGFKAFLLHPVIAHYTLQLVLDSGLDVCGLRLLYPPQGFLNYSAGAVPVIQRTDETCQPVLALAVRGPRAHSVLKDLTSSLKPLMPRETDHHPPEPPLLFSSGLDSQVHRELCLWFSGRVTGRSAQAHNRPLNRVVPSNDRRGVFLCATTKADLLLVVSPAVPPCCYGQVLAVCERRGFSLWGVQRPQLQSNGAAVLGLSNQQARVFCSPHIVTPDQGQPELPSHCLVLLLRKENAVHHSVSLPAALMREFKAQKLLGCLQSRVDGLQTVEPGFCFHTVPYSSNLYDVFVKGMWAVPDPSSVILSHQKCSSDSDKEQVAILTFCGKDMRQGLSLLHRVLTEEPEGGFKLLGLKWLPALSRLQAQELNPYEVGQQLCQDSLDKLMPAHVLVCALKRVDAFASLRKLLPHDYPGNLSVLMSPTPEVAFRQASLFFFEHEMIPARFVECCIQHAIRYQV